MRWRWMQRIVLAGAAALLPVPIVTGGHAAPAELAQANVTFSATGQAQALSATGVAYLPVPQPPAPPILLIGIGVSGRSPRLDRDAAIRAAIERVIAVRAALEKIGVPPASTVISNASVTPVDSGPLSGNAPPLQSYSASADLQVGVGPDKIEAAIQAALAAGALTATRSSGAASRLLQPDSAATIQAVKQASERARTMAQAGAQAFGLTLGKITNVQVQLPSLLAGTEYPVQVSVTVTYDLGKP